MYSRTRTFGAEVHKSNIRVTRWHNKYKILNCIERHNFCLSDLLTNSNRTTLQSHKVEERTWNNFGTPHDSSMLDRIICGIRNLTLLDELLKVYDLDLKECLCLCRVRELSKELKRATEAAESINAVQKQKQEGKTKRKHKIKCSYCKGTKA